MTDHVGAEELLAFFDACLDDVTAARVARHLEQCPQCMARFEAHSEFEASIANLTAMPAELRASARAVTRAVLARRTATAGWQRWVWPLLAAAALLIGFTIWSQTGQDPCVVAIHRQAAGNVVRAGAEDLLHLDVTVAEPAYLALFGRTADGRTQRLLPHLDPTLGDLGVGQPLSPGVVTRVPGAELFDFGLDRERPFVELVLVVAAERLAEPALVELLALIEAAPLGALPPELLTAHPRSQRLAVPR